MNYNLKGLKKISESQKIMHKGEQQIKICESEQQKRAKIEIQWGENKRERKKSVRQQNQIEKISNDIDFPFHHIW